MAFNLWRSTVFGLISIGLISCGGGSGDSKRLAQAVDASNKDIASIAFATSSDYVHLKGNLQLQLLGTTTQGQSLDITPEVSWLLSKPTLGSIATNGLFTPKGDIADSITLTARYAGLSVSKTLVITNANLQRIEVSNSATSVDVCKNSLFTAQAIFEGDLTLNYPLLWQVDSESQLGSFKNPSRGELSSYNSGTLAVSARGVNNQGETLSSNLYYLDIARNLLSVNLSSNKSLSMRRGETASITVTGLYVDESQANITPNVQFTSSDEGTLSINPSTGMITAKQGSFNGTNVTLNANCDGISQDLNFIVLSPEIAQVAIVSATSETAIENLTTADNSSITPRLKVTYNNTNKDTEIYSGNDIEWAIDKTASGNFNEGDISINSQTGEITIGDLNLAQNLRITISARLLNSEGETATGNTNNELKDTLTVTITP